MVAPLHRSRPMWTLFEPVHAITYFSDEARAGFAAVGLKRYWDGYFAGRAAPLGAVGAAAVTAMFSGFSPALVERALPAAWAIASPEQVLDARASGAAATLRRLVPDDDVVARASEALAPIAARVETIGRPLAAANRALPNDDDPYRRLWQATATLREHRGDGHVVALVGEQIAGLSTIILRSGADLDPAAMQRARGWSDDEWMLERAALAERGLLTADGHITAAGAAAVNRAEALTNTLASPPWDALSDGELADIARALHPVAAACSPLYPFPNPIGMPPSWNPDADPEASAVLAEPVVA